MKYTPHSTITRAGARRREPGERERVADVIGDLLDLGPLVVVREDHRAALGGQPPYPVRPLARRPGEPGAVAIDVCSCFRL